MTRTHPLHFLRFLRLSILQVRITNLHDRQNAMRRVAVSDRTHARAYVVHPLLAALHDQVVHGREHVVRVRVAAHEIATIVVVPAHNPQTKLAQSCRAGRQIPQAGARAHDHLFESRAQMQRERVPFHPAKRIDEKATVYQISKQAVLLSASRPHKDDGLVVANVLVGGFGVEVHIPGSLHTVTARKRQTELAASDREQTAIQHRAAQSLTFHTAREPD